VQAGKILAVGRNVCTGNSRKIDIKIGSCFL